MTRKTPKFIKIYATILGATVAAYAFLGLWINRANPDSKWARPFCAAWLCPDEFSPERVYQLQQESAAGESGRAIAEFKRALILDPASAYRWADLGEVMLNAHKVETAKYCFERAVAAGPHSPAILFRAANFYFTIGDSEHTMRCLSRILSNPDLQAYYSPAFLTYSRMNLPIEEVLAAGVPPNELAARSFLRFEMQSNHIDDAQAIWRWMAARSLEDDALTREYLDFLIHNNQAEPAAEAWESLNARHAADYRRTNWVFNGSFEAAPRTSPLDWQIASTEDVEAKRVDGVAKDGRWSLELLFRGSENVDYHGVKQEAVIHPGKWELRAFVKTQDITTDQGVAIRIFDAVQPQRLDASTEALTGTHDWTAVSRTVDAGPQTKLVQVEVMRAASQTFDNKIAGTAWVDSVELTPVR